MTGVVAAGAGILAGPAAAALLVPKPHGDDVWAAVADRLGLRRAGRVYVLFRSERPRIGAARQRIVIGVPTGIIRASRRMSPLRILMQPWEIRPGMSWG